MKIRNAVDAIERKLGGRVLLLAASNLETGLLPPLYDILRGMGRTERLDVILYCRGGIVTAARRVALLLADATDRLGFVVPDRCESSGTIVALAASEIVAGPVAIFSPIDPLLGSENAPGDAPRAISAEDIRLFARMAEQWFGLDEAQARASALSILCQNIFPTTLTSFHRATLEVRALCDELLSLWCGDAKQRAVIVDALVSGFHSHSHALSRDDLAGLGLPIRRDPVVEDAAWEIAAVVRACVGGNARSSEDDDWTDALVVTREGGSRRRRSPGGFGARWEGVVIE